MKNYLFRFTLFVGMFAMLAIVVGPTTYAQDPRLPPTYGTVNLRAGFMPDPFVRNVVAGGPNLTTLGGVRAHVANAPDFRVNYTAGKYALTFYATSSADTTLLINLPNGEWIADDDSGGNLNPMIRLANPPSGQYDIWVGTVGRDTAPAALHVTERR